MDSRQRPPVRLADALRDTLARLPQASGLAEYPLWTEWERVVGRAIAAHARPERLRRGVLVVRVDGSEWMQELQYLKHDVRDRLNERLGRRAVDDIFLVLDGAR